MNIWKRTKQVSSSHECSSSGEEITDSSLLLHEVGRSGWFFWSEAQKVVVFAGPDVVEAQCQRLQVRSKEGGKVLFAADEEEVVMTSEKFTITGETKAGIGSN